MTATEDLRRMLDERGVEYVANDYKSVKETCWSYMGELDAVFAEFGDGETRFVCDTWCFTPEQAIAATLGVGTCHADETETFECVCDGIGHYGKRLTVHVMECSECGSTYEHVNGAYEYCPRCGARIEVVEE